MAEPLEEPSVARQVPGPAEGAGGTIRRLVHALSRRRALASSLFEALASLLYRQTCAGCGLAGRALVCARCASEWEKTSAAELAAELARQDPALGGIWVAGRYRGRVRRLLRAFKYQGRRDLAAFFADKLIAEPDFPRGDWWVVPVPLHRQRQRERGYNQATLLARAIAARQGLTCAEALERVRATTPQHGLGRAERHGNLADAFRAKRSLDGRRILLVDDIATTGATLLEAARALRAAGARTVAVAVVAHTPSAEAPVSARAEDSP